MVRTSSRVRAFQCHRRDAARGGGREGYFHALDARTGKLLWKASLGGQIVMAPITFQVEGKQYVSVIRATPS